MRNRAIPLLDPHKILQLRQNAQRGRFKTKKREERKREEPKRQLYIRRREQMDNRNERETNKDKVGPGSAVLK